MKFFDTETEVSDYIKADNKQYAKENGILVEFEVEYDLPVAILHRKESDSEKKTEIADCIDFECAFISNESGQYDFIILNNNYEASEAWIIQDMDGNVRVWLNYFQGETFFGEETDIVYEKVGCDEYIKVAV